MRCSISAERPAARPRTDGRKRWMLQNVATLAGALIIGLFSGCGRAKEPASVEIFFTSQTRGRLTHCGCFSGQFGGLARLSTAIATRPVGERFGVDVGDALE